MADDDDPVETLGEGPEFVDHALATISVEAAESGLRNLDSPLGAYQVSKAAVISLSRSWRGSSARGHPLQHRLRAVRFLLPADASFVTGIDLVVDGGWTIQTV